MKAELDQMVPDKIVTPVFYWVCSILAVPKKDGSVRICLDPKDLNTALKRSHYHLPTAEYISSRLTNDEVLSVLDAKRGY